MKILFLLFCVLLAQGILFGLRFLLKKRRTVLLRVVLFLVKAVLIPVMGLAVVFFDGYLFWHIPYLTNALYIALIGDVAADLLAAACWLFTKDRKFKTAAVASLVLSVTLMVLGSWNATHIVPREFEFTSDKLSGEYTVIFVSDTHVGSAQSFGVLEKMVEDMVAEQPDYIILGGDIVDEFTTREEMQDTFALFGSTGVPTFFIYGNHDRQALADYADGRLYTEEELVEAIEGSGVVILSEEFTVLGDDLVLLGREDASQPERRADSTTLVSPSADAFLLCADHSPYMTQDIEIIQADLQLSGHSHAGQLFPNQAVYNFAGFDAYGVYERFGTTLYVSSGAGTWRVPFRSEERCTYDVIRLIPAA